MKSITQNAAFGRRDFLKGAAALGGALTAGALATGCDGKPKSSAGAATASGETGAGLTADSATQKWAFEIAPEAIADSEIKENVSADVIVVGAGTSGLVTAVSAAEAGLDVIVVSASAKPVARGGSNNAIYCKAMERAGISKLTPFQFQKEIFYASNQVDERKWYKHYNNSETAMNWSIDLMEKAGYKVKVELGTPLPEDSLYHETCSIGWELGDGMDAGEFKDLGTGMMQPAFVKELARHLTEDLGGRIDFNTVGTQLVRGGKPNGTDGRVDAVICQKSDGSYAKYTGTKAVVLATGDFSANKDMMYKYAPSFAPYIADSVYEAKANYDVGFQYGGLLKGDGHKMGLWVGAGWQKVFPNCVMGGFFGPGPRNLYSNFLGLQVNRNGERFMNENVLSPCGGANNFGQPGKTVFALWNEEYARCETVSGSWNNDSMLDGDAESIAQSVIASWEDDVKKGATVKADTMEELISKLGLPASTMDTVKRYNELCAAGADTDYYKEAEHMHPLEKGPFYGQSSAGVLVFLTVLGGLNTDANLRVLDDDDNVIEGLYNVGTMVGDMFAGNYSFMVEGANYGANCLTFGYLTGKFIANQE
ncbi:MAG: FAD-binding protein [Eggerthellaceae bacterium]|nr:FAD-binding protein [Eggerthellaceae bacterium]